MYYTSENKTDCEDYNSKVTQAENYQDSTQNWAEVIEHKNGGMFAILKHDKYESTMSTTENLEGWFNDANI